MADREDESILIELTEVQLMKILSENSAEAQRLATEAQTMHQETQLYLTQIADYRDMGYNVRIFYDMETQSIHLEPEERIIGFN